MWSIDMEMMDYEEFKGKIAKYFDDCSKVRPSPLMPDEPGMILALGLIREEYDEYTKTEPYARLLKQAKLKRESWLNRKMANEKAAAAGCMNLLKQEENGGYSDKPTENKQKEITVKLAGFEGFKE